MNFKLQQIIFGLSLFLIFTGCKTMKDQVSDKSLDEKSYSIDKIFDEESKTYYFLTKIDHKSKDGKLIKLRTEHAVKVEGETVREFATRTNSTLAFNASTQREISKGNIKPTGTQIVDGKIISEAKSSAYILGIKDDNRLLTYEPNTSAAAILKDGTNNALTAFGPLIENHQKASEEALKVRSNYTARHPRQVIAQLDNLDIIFLSCGGRDFDGEGMTADDIIRILMKKDVKYAYMLDGGGSTSIVVKGELITKKIDKKGTAERLRPNFLFFK